MRRTFQFWLFVSVALSFAALFYLTYYLQTKEAFRSAENLIELRMEDAKKQRYEPLLGRLIVSLEQSQRMRSRRDCETKDKEDV